MRFLQASDILEHAAKYMGGASASFAWRGAWLTRSDLTGNVLWQKNNPLRRIPGLRYSRLPSLLFSQLFDKPIPFPAQTDAVQVGKSGDRLRAFNVHDAQSLKVVREDSHYGPTTKHEVALRQEIARDATAFLVPRMEGWEQKGNYLFVREELIAGRSYNVRRDRNLFIDCIVRPLADFYVRRGIMMMPLSEALGPMTAFAQTLEDQVLKNLLARNPMTAVSLCHNDVVSSNLAVTKKGVYFLDWGSAIFSICGRDFVRIGERYLPDQTIKAAMDKAIHDLNKGGLSLDDVLLVQNLWRQYIKKHGARAETGAFLPRSP